MDQHTSAAKQWLDRRYSRRADGGYKAHQPIQGLHTDCSEPNAQLRLARTYKLLDWMRVLRFESVLDSGGGEGYLAALIRDRFSPKVVHTCDLSVEANLRAWELFGVNGVSADASRLPFADGAYDLVVCSEVIEHLSHPALAIGELMRVARKYIILSTAEFSPLGEVERRLRVLTLDRDYPHAELNWFAPADFTLLMGENTVMSPQFRGVAHQMPLANRPASEVARILLFLSDVTHIGVDQTGVIAIQAKDGSSPQPPRFDPAWTQATLDRLLDGPATAQTAKRPPAVDAALEQRLQCPRCSSNVQLQDSGVLTLVHRLLGTLPGHAGRPRDARRGVRRKHAGGTRGRVRGAPGGGSRGSPPADSRLDVSAPRQQCRTTRAVVHWIAGQCLRIVWLFGRSEPWMTRLGRVTRRVFGPAAGEDATMMAALAWTPPGRLDPDTRRSHQADAPMTSAPQSSGRARPRVVPVILNTNHRDDTLECLASLASGTYPLHRTIVLDNASSDGSVEAIRRPFRRSG